jgi:hypothetical protein
MTASDYLQVSVCRECNWTRKSELSLYFSAFHLPVVDVRLLGHYKLPNPPTISVHAAVAIN